MEGEEPSELYRRVLVRVELVISSVNGASHVDQVIVALYSLAACLFPLDVHLFSGSVDDKFRDQLLVVEVPKEVERIAWRNAFYKGSAFRVFARVLLYDVASNWLACFPKSARKQLYDVFFVNSYTVEIVQVVVPCLQQIGSQSHDSNAICLNAERLLILCLLENNGVLQIARDFSVSHYFENLSQEQLRQTISRVAQLVTSIPDKARLGAPSLLLPHTFFNTITAQLLHGALERDDKLFDEPTVSNVMLKDGAMLFTGAIFARVCRRGFTDALLSNIIPLILRNVQSVLLSSSDLVINEVFESKPGFCFWLNIMEAVNDSHSVERIAQELLRRLVVYNVSDVLCYWVVWILFGQLFKSQSAIRSTFLEKFILWKVFPVRCLRWILHFAVLECAPDTSSSLKSHKTRKLSETVRSLAIVWSKIDFVRSAPTEQQAYVTAGLGLCLERMTKEDLDGTKDALQSILQGITCRLESPMYLVRKMACSIAFVFSKSIDPQKPLFLDDSCQEETIDWEFGLTTTSKTSPKLHGADKKCDDKENSSDVISEEEIQKSEDNELFSTLKTGKKVSTFNLVDPDEIIDPATLNTELNKDDYESEGSESSNESLQPYDLTDDDTDLTQKFSQLVDVVGALRKSDDPEGVEKALDIAEKLVRASPHELKFVAGDLAKTLVLVRCSDLTIEGEEASAEEKRQKALVALIVTCPVESLDSLSKLIYSPNVDISQRIMVLDVMTDAAQELASAKFFISKNFPKPLISPTSDQPWFEPRNNSALGAGPWKQISSRETPLNWFYSYERQLPSKSNQMKRGKRRQWSIRSAVPDVRAERSQNIFPQYAAAFMLPAMQRFDKKSHGIDLLGRDFIVLGKLIHMLGVCMKCAAMHPEASVLAFPLLDMLRSREISHHAEPYVRRSVLFAVSCVLLALHPSFVASAVIDVNIEISEKLEWVRTWALHVAESDADRECHTLAMACLQLHAEMVLQASRAYESTKHESKTNSISIFPISSNKSIKLSF